jgi:hypothetical protein
MPWAKSSIEQVLKITFHSVHSAGPADGGGVEAAQRFQRICARIAASKVLRGSLMPFAVISSKWIIDYLLIIEVFKHFYFEYAILFVNIFFALCDWLVLPLALPDAAQNAGTLLRRMRLLSGSSNFTQLFMPFLSAQVHKTGLAEVGRKEGNIIIKSFAVFLYLCIL